MSNRKKIIITGASGFLGRNLVNAFKEKEDYMAVAVSSHPSDLKRQIGGGNVLYLHKDATKDVAENVNNAIIVNCAYPRNATGTAVAEGLQYIRSVFETAIDNNATAIVNISSQSVYSQDRTEIATEKTQLCLDNTYAVGKYAVELLLESICKGSGTNYTNLRLASLIGPGFNQRVVNRLIIKMLNHEPVTIVRQEKRLGFLDVEDAVRAVLSVINLPTNQWKSVYNVGNGKGYTVEQIFNEIKGVLEEQMQICDPILEHGTDTSTSAVSYKLLNADTSFMPQIKLKDSIKRIIGAL